MKIIIILISIFNFIIEIIYDVNFVALHIFNNFIHINNFVLIMNVALLNILKIFQTHHVNNFYVVIRLRY